MRKTLIILSTIILISSCSEKENVPDGIIPPPEMAQIIAEIYNTEYKVGHVGLKSDSIKKVFEHYELYIYEKYGVNDSIYKNSFTYYLEHPLKMEELYDIVIDSLSFQEQVREAEHRKKKEKQKEAKDSEVKKKNR